MDDPEMTGAGVDVSDKDSESDLCDLSDNTESETDEVASSDTEDIVQSASPWIRVIRYENDRDDPYILYELSGPKHTSPPDSDPVPYFKRSRTNVQNVKKHCMAPVFLNISWLNFTMTIKLPAGHLFYTIFVTKNICL